MNYKISTDDFSNLEGNYNIIKVIDNIIYVSSDVELSSPFESISELPLSLVESQQVELDKAKEAKIEEIDKDRDEAAQLSVSYKDKKIQATDADKALLTQTISLYSSVGSTPEGFGWITEDNTILEVTLEDLVAIGGLIGQQTNEAYIKARKLKDQVLLALTIEEVNAIKFKEKEENVK